MNIALHYTEHGNGYPLLLLHGNGESSDYFRHQIEPFSQQFRVITVDTRGHGKSPRGTAPFTLKQFSDDLYGFMTAHGIAKAHILGFSDGAYIALLFALKHPEMVNRLILNGADLNTAGVKRLVQKPIELGFRLVSLISRIDPKSVAKKEMLGLMVGQPDVDPQTLQKLDIPSLVIVGTKDMIKDEHSALIARSIPGCQLIRIPGDHFIAAKNSEPFNKAVLEFLLEE